MGGAAAGAVSLLLLLGGGAGDDAPAAPTRAAAPLEYPGLRVWVAERRIEADASFAIVDAGVFLEYVAVGPQGKVHESLLRLEADPKELNLALLLCGLEPRPEVEYQGAPVELSGPLVEVEVAWKAGEEARRARVEDLLEDARTGGSMPPVGFAFTGSRFITARQVGPDGKRAQIFAASSSGSGIALYHDPDAVLDNPLLSGGDVPLLAPTFRMPEVVGWVAGDERLRPRAERLPPTGTEAVLHLRPLPAAATGTARPEPPGARPGAQGAGGK